MDVPGVLRLSTSLVTKLLVGLGGAVQPTYDLHGGRGGGRGGCGGGCGGGIRCGELFSSVTTTTRGVATACQV